METFNSRPKSSRQAVEWAEEKMSAGKKSRGANKYITRDVGKINIVSYSVNSSLLKLMFSDWIHHKFSVKDGPNEIKDNSKGILNEQSVL